MNSLNNQSKADWLIGEAAALIKAQAYDLKFSHTVHGEWPESEADVKTEHDMLLEVADELKKLKGSCQGILDTSDHIADPRKMVPQGDVTLMGDFIDEEGSAFVRIQEWRAKR